MVYLSFYAMMPNPDPHFAFRSKEKNRKRYWVLLVLSQSSFKTLDYDLKRRNVKGDRGREGSRDQKHWLGEESKHTRGFWTESRL